MWPQDRQRQHRQRNADSWAPPRSRWVRSSEDFEKSSRAPMAENRFSADYGYLNMLHSRNKPAHQSHRGSRAPCGAARRRARR